MRSVSAQDLNALTPEQFRDILAGPAEEAMRWLHAAAEQGIVEAQVHYAQRLLDGVGAEADPQTAFQWFRLAAGQGHVMAMNMAGRCYENGWGVEADALMATYWFRLAAQAGLDWGMYNYATSLALGRGVAQNRQEALLWLRKAVALGHVKSWNLLGGFHEDGWGVPVDLEIALDCYGKAAQGGDFRGEFNCGRLLAVRGELSPALVWFRRAHDNPAATSAFRSKLKAFLRADEQQALHALESSLADDAP